MENTLYASLVMALLCTACQNEAETELQQEKEYTVSIMARIGKPVSDARYVQQAEDIESAADFATDDKIGVYMDDNDEAVCWTYSGISWTTEKTLYWEDKESEHTFYAYYPYSETGSTGIDKVKMPSLSKQDGSWENIPKYDFLVASKKLSYNDAAGVVSFTDNNAFKHVSSLLKIGIKAEGNMKEANIRQITLEKDGLTDQSYYSFDTECVTFNGNTENTLRIDLDHFMNNQDVFYYFILNGKGREDAATNNPIVLTIQYTLNDKSYIARHDELCPDLQSGCIYEYNLKINDDKIIIEGGSISGWTPGNDLEEIIIKGEEVEPTNQ